ncbi:MAG: bifunctional nuclease domain-containing protein [Bdellovibrionales bacterium]
MGKRLDVELKATAEWLELEPYGVTTSADSARPVMLFKAIGGEEVLPVWLSPIDAGIAITQHNVKLAGLSPHDLTSKVLESLNVHLDTCLFTEVKGHHQYVELHFSGSRRLKSIVARADQAISFSLHAKARFYARREYIQASRVMNAEMVGNERDLKLNPKAGKNRHPYLN